MLEDSADRWSQLCYDFGWLVGSLKELMICSKDCWCSISMLLSVHEIASLSYSDKRGRILIFHALKSGIQMSNPMAKRKHQNSHMNQLLKSCPYNMTIHKGGLLKIFASPWARLKTLNDGQLKKSHKICKETWEGLQVICPWIKMQLDHARQELWD